MGESEVAFSNLVQWAYMARLQLASLGFTPMLSLNVNMDQMHRNTFHYFTLSNAVSAARDYKTYPALVAPATLERILRVVERVQSQKRGAAR